jgi:hypothetical protein
VPVRLNVAQSSHLARFANFDNVKAAAIWVQAAYAKGREESATHVQGTGFFAQLGAPVNQKLTVANRYAALQPQCKAEAAQQLQTVLGEKGVSRWADATIRGYAIDRYSDGKALRKITALVDARSPPKVEQKNRALLDKLDDLELEIKGARARGEEVKADNRALERWRTTNANLVSQLVELKVTPEWELLQFCLFCNVLQASLCCFLR